MTNQFQSLRFTPGERIQWLTESQIAETNFFKHCERLRKISPLTDLRKELDRFAHSQLEQIVNGIPVQFYLQHVRLKTAAFALRASHVKIAQELHLDLFETGARASFAAAAAGVERERACSQSLRHRFRLHGE